MAFVAVVVLMGAKETTEEVEKEVGEREERNMECQTPRCILDQIPCEDKQSRKTLF